MLTRLLDISLTRCSRAVAACLLAAAVLAGNAALAQEQFFTQSGGRGLQNAKLNARMSKTEKDVVVIQEELAKVQPHAKTPILNCNNTGDKLRWDGTNWTCNQETDPTVQGWAKEELPSCGTGQILSVSGGRFNCAASGFLSTEMDPTVQQFAKTALPNCGSGEVLSVSGGNLSCIADERGLTREVDPMVHDFARNDKGGVPNCNASETLTMMNGRLQCRFDQIGITVETDPLVQGFARNDIAGYALAACGANEVITAETQGANVVLACVAAADVLSGALALDDLSDVTVSSPVSGNILIYSGGTWLNGSEADPNVEPWAKQTLATCGAGQVLTYNGTSLSCINDAGGAADPINLGDLGDVNLGGLANGQFLKWNGSNWVPGTVEDFAQTALPTCGTGQVLTGDGSNLTCVNDSGGAADPIALGDLADVSLSGSASGQVLRFNGTAWINANDRVQGLTTGKWCRTDGTSVICDQDEPLTCAGDEVLKWNGTTWACVNVASGLGLGTIAVQDADAVAITGGAIDGTVIGGTTPAAGTFTNLTATGSASATVVQAGGLLVTGNGRVMGSLQVDGNLMVSGSQTIDGVTFANGGIQLSGHLEADSVSVSTHVSVSGNLSAANFIGDGSGLTNLPAGAVQAAGAVGDIQFKGADNGISATAALNWNEPAKNLAVSGTMQLATSVAACSTGSDYGKVRLQDLGSGDVRLQFCRP